jgi:hypothetical protein
MKDFIEVRIRLSEDGTWFEGPLLEFKTLIDKAVECVPEEFRESATIKSDWFGDGERDPYVISYYRPKTAEVIAAEKEKAAQQYQHILREKRKQYDRLKQELGL